MSKVLFASVELEKLDASASLPAKFERMLDATNIKNVVSGKTVAIKMHMGRAMGYTTIHPMFVKILVNKVKEWGGKVYITDNEIESSADRGYTAEALGCPIVAACGETGKYYVEKKIDYKSLRDIDVAGHVADADVLIDLSHVKGHGACGFGGAVKNISMGCVSDRTRQQTHGLEGGIIWDEDKCVHCGACVSNCNHKANSFNDEGKYEVFYHHCTYCHHCVKVCPTGAIQVDPNHGYEDFQMGMALTTQKCLEDFAKGHIFYINFLLNMTLVCDCWGFTTPSIVPDVGILASEDIVSIERASLDMIKTENFNPACLPKGQPLHEVDGHLLEKLHGKNPFIQLDEIEKIGMGESKYELEEIR